jgi:signal transduction histidine kinase
MSHDLRTPLNAIIGYSELLEEEASERGDDYMLDVGRVASSGRSLLSLINGVLDLSKVEAGKMEVNLERFDLDDLIRGVEGTIGPLVGKNSNRLDVIKPFSLGQMDSDPTKVRQVLFNLLGNACKFTNNGVISLTAEVIDENGFVQFTVGDTGVGMTAEQLVRVFDAFAQAEDTTARDFGGTGLGLTITRQFCEILGGTIQVQSEPALGSTFVVRLPRHSLAESTGGSSAQQLPARLTATQKS